MIKELNVLVWKHFNALRLIRSIYSNWLDIVFAYFRRTPVKHAVLRGGLILRPSRPFSILQLLSLASLVRNGWCITLSDKDYITLKDKTGTTIKLRLSTGADLESFEEVFVRKPYGRIFTGFVIIDAGAYNGDSALYFAKSGATQVIGLEPDTSNYYLAQKNIMLNGLSRSITLLNMALSSTGGRVKILLSKGCPHVNSINPPPSFKRALPYDSVLEVETVTLSDLIRRFKLDFIDLVKIDCEGAEYDIIRNMTSDEAAKIKRIVLEFHQGLSDLEHILQNYGFIVRHKGKQGGYLWATKLQFDDWFVSTLV